MMCPLISPASRGELPTSTRAQGAHLIGLEIERQRRGGVAQRERDRRVPRDRLRPVRRDRERQGIPEVGDPGRSFLRQRFRDSGSGNRRQRIAGIDDGGWRRRNHALRGG